MWKKEFDDAIKHFEAVLKSNPDNFETLKVLGWLYAKQGGQSDEPAAGEWNGALLFQTATRGTSLCLLAGAGAP